MIPPAARIRDLEPSAIRLISDPAPADAIPLGLGQPTWDMPEEAREALASVSGPCPYGPNAGRLDLRAAVAEFSGAPGPENVLITVGTQGAIFDLFAAYVDAGDQVLVPDPGFVAYPTLARMMGAEPVSYPLAEGDRFRLDPGAFEDALARAPRARVALLNIPANPTGGGASRAALERVARAAEARGVLVISDEVYRELHLGERPASLRDVSDQGVVISSVSKAFGAPGLRVGWVVGPEEVVKRAGVVHGYAATAASHPAQGAALALIEARDRVLAASREEVRRRFSALRDALREHLGMAAEPPDGSFYHWLPLPESAHSDPTAFCVRLRDEGKVVLIPGEAFGPHGRRHARLSFAASEDQIREGVRRLAPFWRAS